jgi:hypothetical protein
MALLSLQLGKQADNPVRGLTHRRRALRSGLLAEWQAYSMKRDRINVWKFDDAPDHLKRWYGGSQSPQWIALIPDSIYGPDIDKAIRAQSELHDLHRYQTENGDVVYTGSARLDLFLHAASAKDSKVGDQS